MTATFAVECFADEDVLHVLMNTCGLSLSKMHRSNKGEVIKHVCVARDADVGMVDEDPMSAQPASLREAISIRKEGDVELRRHGKNHILVLMPRLEECFIKAMSHAGLEPRLASRAADLHRLLGTENQKRHDVFREDLRRLTEESKAKRIHTFMTTLESMLRDLIGGGGGG